MNQFRKGFTIGVVSSLALVTGYYVSFMNSTTDSADVQFDSGNPPTSIFQSPLLDSNIQQSKTREDLVSQVSIEKTKSQINTDTPYTEDDNNIAALNNKKNTTKNKIINKLDQFNQSDLARIEHILNRLNAKQPKELFDEEAIDYQWSEKRQVELEYNYYDKSQLKDVGELESISCKSRHCRVRVQIPADFEFNPSYVLGWSQPASVGVLTNNEQPGIKTVEIFIARKSQEITDNE